MIDQIKAGSWVHILSSGQYGSDSGLVISVNSSSNCTKVVLLPHIKLDASSSQSPNSLFNPNAVKNHAGVCTIQLESRYYIYVEEKSLGSRQSACDNNEACILFLFLRFSMSAQLQPLRAITKSTHLICH